MRIFIVTLALTLAGCSTVAGQRAQAVKERAINAAEETIDQGAIDAYSILCQRLSYRAEMELRGHAGITRQAFSAFCNRSESADETR